ncbi:MAG: tRNA (guanosine(46)-N7)-methyltransferase TrmB [Planctomycetota bacterium]|nr:tRNA (guanosine(46)-N7)-methyltransferase TrmB [Planctomycetota bacterium]MDA0933636.1 tRNA (guanosine(46)-N7)-methyltransferase TrmB [Planctomycetota bacterium]MDA1221754.1 tRNA (guanosine(46)-N7)-methyltransferase TrmB [Planctomycetota bacterium]
MSADSAPGEVLGRAHRMSVGGKLSFRKRVPPVEVRGKLPIVVGGDDPPPLADLIPTGFGKVEIEVGSGKGAYLVAATEVRPDTFFIGIEAAGSYATFAADRLVEAGRTNAVLLVDNARLYLEDRVPERSIDRLHVYFPDPWPKRRHRGRRFFTEDAPRLAHRVLRPGGHLLVATDNPGYAGQIARVLGASPLLVRDENEERALIEAGPGHAFSPTNFERKYIAEGRIIRRFAFRTVSEAGA